MKKHSYYSLLKAGKTIKLKIMQLHCNKLEKGIWIGGNEGKACTFAENFIQPLKTIFCKLKQSIPEDYGTTNDMFLRRLTNKSDIYIIYGWNNYIMVVRVMLCCRYYCV